MAFFVVIETVQQLHFLRSTSWNDRDLCIVAVNPDVYREATGLGLACYKLDAFGSLVSLARYGEISLALIDKFVDVYDGHWRDALRGVRAGECVSARLLNHALKGLLDALLVRGLPLLAAMRALQPEAVLVFPSAYVFNGYTLSEKPVSGLSTFVAPFLAQQAGVPAIAVETGGVAALPHMEVPRFHRSPIPFSRALALFRLVESSPAYAGVTRDDSPTLLVVRDSVDGWLSGFVDRWRDGGVRQIADALPPQRDYGVSLPVLREMCSAVANHVADVFWNDTESVQCFELREIDIRCVVLPFLDSCLRGHMAQMLETAHYALPYYAGFGRAVLLSGGMAHLGSVLTRAARLSGLRTVNQHKGGLGYLHFPMFERYDMLEAEFFCAMGPAAAEMLRKPCIGAAWRHEWARAVPVPVGASWLEGIFRERASVMPQKGRTVCFVMDAFLGDNVYLSNMHIPPFMLSEAEMIAYDIAAKHPEWECLFKPYPMSRCSQLVSPNMGILGSGEHAHIHVLPEMSIQALIGKVDLFVMFSHGTPLPELAASESSLLLYMDKGVYVLDPDAKEHVARRTHFVETLDDFRHCLEFLLSHPEAIAKPLDDGFIRQYCIGDDGVPMDDRLNAFCVKLLD